jgi:GntR family transcriptional repressor for pyruvate dehydrogenase complex
VVLPVPERISPDDAAETYTALAEVLERFLGQWEACDGTTPPSLAEHLPPSGDLRRIALSELIKIEQERALDVIEVRKCMEGWTAYYAAQRALPEDLRRLEGIVTEMERNLEGLKPSQDLDAHFHVVIAQATHNIVWLHLMQSIFDAMKEFQQSVWRAVYLTDADHRNLFIHHREVFEAIRDKDPQRASDAMLKHLTFAEQRSSSYVRRAKE